MAKKVNDTVISVKHVAKDFVLPHEKSNSIKSKIVQVFKEKDNSQDIQHALRDISFEVKKGEFFGIVGRNGSGKSTLLKIISQIYKPTKGSVDIKGRLVPFIELGVGFNPDLTGRENVYLNGALLGFSRKEIDAQYDDIVEFAELKEFMDQKLKNYSSGMQVRLAFSVAIRADSDILILDEVLAVGDEAFQRKCNDYFFKAKREGKTVVLVTHSMDSVRQFCDRAIFIDAGLIKAEGNPDKVANKYSQLFVDEYIQERDSDKIKKHKPNKELSDVKLSDVRIVQDGKSVTNVVFRKKFSIVIDLHSARIYKDVIMGVHVVDQAGRTVLRTSTRQLGEYELVVGENYIRFDVDNVFTEGEYYVNIAIEVKRDGKLLIQEQELAKFAVTGLNPAIYSKLSLTHPDVKIYIGNEV